MSADVTVTREIAAPAQRVWEMVSDLTRMGEWSPENQGGEWTGGATGPSPGARFKGVNRNGSKSWKTSVKVLDAEPGRSFRFKVSLAGLPIAEWGYSIQSSGTGSLVTETWTDHRPGFFKPLARMATGVSDRAAYNRGSMEQTLERLAAAAESESG